MKCVYPDFPATSSKDQHCSQTYIFRSAEMKRRFLNIKTILRNLTVAQISHAYDGSWQTRLTRLTERFLVQIDLVQVQVVR